MDEINSAAPPPVTGETLRSLTRTLRAYRAGKAHLEARVLAAENWWRLRSESEEGELATLSGGDFRSKSAWLHNVIVSKHADGMEAFPEPVILPRESGDEPQARMLSAVVPVVLAQNRFEDVYADELWSKLKTGTGVYKVVWDASKLKGLGDITVERVDLLNLFWEPGVEDIQKSRYFFHTALTDNETLEQRYPQLRGKLKGDGFSPARFAGEDAAPAEGKSTVVDCYYKKWEGGAEVLHYVKYVSDTLLYSSENEGRPLYAHGRYPFVFDTLFPVEGSPCGYGFVDVCRNPQTALDLMDTAFLRNTMVGATPRYFKRGDAGVNEQEFLDLSKSLVTVDGNLGDDALKIVDYRPLSGNYLEYRSAKLRELRETSGNTETSAGLTSQGVTAASAIAALQEASGKGSRDSTRTSYRAFAELVGLVIELIREFYDAPRRFRITGPEGEAAYVSFDNAALRAPAAEGAPPRLSVFDVEVKAQKAPGYDRLSRNELALQFYKLGFFEPGRAEQALACLDMMDFEGRESLRRALRERAEGYRESIEWRQLALSLAMKYEPETARGLAARLTGREEGRAAAPAAASGAILPGAGGESGKLRAARERARAAAQPGGAP